MDKFVVSARKYRPQTFNTVVGQAHISTTLKNAIKNNQLAHAFLFCGPRGVGKTTCARILAKTINCQNIQPDGEACNACQSCNSFNDGGSLNIFELDGASNNKVEDMHEVINSVRIQPTSGKYKIYIIDEVHMLSANAFNAFLKTLEEPPPYAIFILATTEKHKILPTILSRCQIFDFKRITTNDTVEHLQEIVTKEQINADKAALQIIAQKSEGCMRDALSILDKIVSFTNGTVTYTNTLEHLNILDHDYYFKLLELLQQQDLAGAMLLYDEINRKGFEGDLVLNGFSEFLRNILVCKDARAAQLLDVVEGMQQKYQSTATNTSASFIVSALNILNEAEINFKMARNKKLHVELTLIKLNFLQQAINLSINETGTVLKKKQVDAPIAFKFQSIPSLQINTAHHSTAKLYVEEKPIPQPQTNNSNPANTSPSTVAEPSTNINHTSTHQPIKKQLLNSGSKKNLLEVLREKAGDKYIVEPVKEAEVLNPEKLQQCWNNYTALLQQQNDKLSTAGTFKIAKLNIIDDIQFTVTVHALTQQKFIEQEKLLLADFIHTTFNNRTITFSVLVEDAEEKTDVPLHLKLNSKQRFDRIAEQYPLIKELKEKLKLEIIY